MYLKEYEGRELFVKYGIRIPEGRLFSREEVSGPRFRNARSELERSLSAFDEFVLKAQLLSGHRGQRGGVRFTDREHLEEDIKRMFGQRFGDETTDEILAEGKLEIEREFFLSLSIDRFSALPVFLISQEGGVAIEELAFSQPSQVRKILFDYVSVFPEKKIIAALSRLPAPASADHRNKIMDICRRLSSLFFQEDAILAEINPLVLTKQGEFYAADAKIAIDDNAIKRHPSFLLRFFSHLTPLEQTASANDLSYVELDGDIAVIGNGAGLVMATLDTVSFYGGTPANFCDIGGGASMEMMKKAMALVLKKKDIRCVFVDVFGGITHCDEIARGIVEYVQKNDVAIPMVVRMTGTNSETANTLLAGAGIRVHVSFDDACREAAKLSHSYADSH